MKLAGDTAKAVSYWATIQGQSIHANGTCHGEVPSTKADWRITSREIPAG